MGYAPPFVGVNLRNIADPDSDCASGFASLKWHNGFDHVFVDRYIIMPKAIYRRLTAKYQAVLQGRILQREKGAIVKEGIPLIAIRFHWESGQG